jgi:NAD(P)-dependent dehydrogenase (short-subunit alcohol dehydrogenase family)
MDVRFDGQTAVITGGSHGIGRVCAELFLEAGAKVAIVANDLFDSVEALSTKGTVRGYALDVTKVADTPAVVAQIRADLGEIDVLVQAAGIMPNRPADQITEEEWDRTYDVNAKGLFFMMQAVTGQSMIPRGSGAIVNFASMAGVRGMREPLCSAHYSGSKGAVVQLTRQGAVEWGKHGIRVNAVVPGGVKVGRLAAAPPEVIAMATQTIPLQKLSEPIDVAAAVLFLASPWARMITGQLIYVDGGGSARY